MAGDLTSCLLPIWMMVDVWKTLRQIRSRDVKESQSPRFEDIICIVDMPTDQGAVLIVATRHPRQVTSNKKRLVLERHWYEEMAGTKIMLVPKSS